MRLRSVSIAGFRSIESLRGLEIGSPTVLAGHNDAGKTAIIDAIFFLLGGYRLTPSDRTYLRQSEGGDVVDDPQDATEHDDVRRVHETIVEGEFELRESELEFGTSPLRLRRVSRGGGSPILEVLKWVPADHSLRDYASLKVDVLRDRLDGLGLDTTGLKADLLARLAEAAASAEQAEMWTTADTGLDRALPTGQRFDAASAVNAETAIQTTLQSAYRGHLESEELQGSVRGIEAALEEKLVADAENIRDHIMANVRDIGDVSIRPTVSFSSANGLKSTEITVQNSAGEDISLHVSGAGRARRIALAVWEYNSTVLARSGEDVVLLYDEPDTHLDYAHQRELMHLIHEQTLHPNVAVVIASHSLNLVDGTDISDVVHIRHVDHRTILERLADDSDVGSHLGAIAASIGLRNTVLLHERLFVGVEGESEARALPVLFKLATGRYLESCGIALWPCGNNEGALQFAKFLVAHGRNVAFLVDEDSRTQAKHIFNEARLGKAGLDPDLHCLWLGDPNEIEDVFSDEQWAAAANASWPRDNPDEPSALWEAADFAAHRSGKFSSSILDMVRTASSAAPSGKPEMLLTLSLSLSDPSEVPVALKSKFALLVERAK